MFFQPWLLPLHIFDQASNRTAFCLVIGQGNKVYHLSTFGHRLALFGHCLQVQIIMQDMHLRTFGHGLAFLGHYLQAQLIMNEICGKLVHFYGHV